MKKRETGKGNIGETTARRKEENCCGCLACANACPKGAIDAVEDERGFVYPRVDFAKCVDCGLCERICDFVKENDENAANAKPLATFALAVKNKKTLRESTSGGAFTAISNVVLAEGGAVVGVVLDDEFNVRFAVAETPEERDKMRGSKYVQAFAGDVYARVKTLLDAGRTVAFFGTPCQTAALNAFLRKDYENLMTVDALCHGAPNNRLFKEHIAYLETVFGRAVKGYSWRDKAFGWNGKIEAATLENGATKRTVEVQRASKLFNSNVSLRPSCFRCKYRSYRRPSDLTIGDFWGIERIVGKTNARGVSFLAVNGEKGRRFFEKIDKNAVELRAVPWDDAKRAVSLKPLQSRRDVEKFWALYENVGYVGALREYCPIGWKTRVRLICKKIKRTAIKMLDRRNGI